MIPVVIQSDQTRSDRIEFPPFFLSFSPDLVSGLSKNYSNLPKPVDERACVCWLGRLGMRRTEGEGATQRGFEMEGTRTQ